MRPQATHRPCANSCKQTQAGSAVQEPGGLAGLRSGFWKQIDHPVVGSVDAAGNVGLTKYRRLHLKISAEHVKALPRAHDAIRDAHNVIRVVDAFEIAFGGHRNALHGRRWLDAKLGC